MGSHTFTGLSTASIYITFPLSPVYSLSQAMSLINKGRGIHRCTCMLCLNCHGETPPPTHTDHNYNGASMLHSLPHPTPIWPAPPHPTPPHPAPTWPTPPHPTLPHPAPPYHTHIGSSSRKELHLSPISTSCVGGRVGEPGNEATFLCTYTEADNVLIWYLDLHMQVCADWTI